MEAVKLLPRPPPPATVMGYGIGNGNGNATGNGNVNADANANGNGRGGTIVMSVGNDFKAPNPHCIIVDTDRPEAAIRLECA